MAKSSDDPQVQWSRRWIESVANGSLSMSSRKLSSIVKRGGGLKAVSAVARKHRVHLLMLEDDRGDKLIAASRTPFKIIT